MKNLFKTHWFIFLSVIIILNSGSKLPSNISEKNHLVYGNDSLAPVAKPSYQEIYYKDYKWTEMIGNLKFDPSTKVESYILKINDQGDETRIKLYHNKNRMIRIEKRIYDKTNQEMNYDMYDFDTNNACLSLTQWGLKENMSYTYAMHWGSLIKYDVNCKLIELNPAQKQQIIQSVKVTLESIMQHFPGYKYSFNWI